MLFKVKCELPLPSSSWLIFLVVMILTSGGVRVLGQGKTVTYYDDPSSVPVDMPVTLKHMTARVSFVPLTNTINGSVRFSYVENRSGDDSLRFYAPDFTVQRVLIDSLPVSFHKNGTNLVIASRARDQKANRHVHIIQIDYSASPKSGLIYFIGWQPEEAGKRKQIWAHRPHGWLPYMDARITVDMYITFDKMFNVFSNGERVRVSDNPDGTRTWHYTMKKDHPFFSTALAIGDYDYKRGKTARGIPLEFWYYRGMEDRISTTYRYTERMFDFFEKELEFNYPYPLYREAPVIDYMYGAMETTTSTIFGDYMQITPRSWWQRNYVNVNAHELAHQWFGNCVAHLVNKDVWLTESFATFYAKLFEKHIYGDDYWQNIRNDEMTLTFEAAKLNSYPVGGSQGGVQRIYQKGSLVLEMLRNLMGEEEFRQAVKLYLNRYAFNYSETSDFIRCVWEAGGKPYNWFFDQWILRGGEPDYLVTDSSMQDSAGQYFTLFNVKQVQPVNELNGLFRMPIRFEVRYRDGTYDSTIVWVEKEETLVKIPNPGKKEIAYLLFDPNRMVLKKVTFRQSPSRLQAQALNAPNMIDRYDALLGLRELPVEEKLNCLADCYQKERFHLIKSEILKQLRHSSDPRSVSLTGTALLDPSALVRKTALQVMDSVPVQYRQIVEGMLYDSSFVNVELALEQLCLSFPANLEHYLDQTKDMTGWRGLNIRMKWLEIAIAGGKKEFLQELIGYTSPRYEFETRMNAFSLLKSLDYYDDETKKNALQAGRHWNNKLSKAACEYFSPPTP
jgi:aminopeptidase N